MTYLPRNADSMGQEDMTLPEMKLIQNVGGDKAKIAGANPGQFYNTLTEEIYDTFNMIVVDFQKTRTYWGRDEIASDNPECQSLNAKSMVSTDGSDCNTCSHRMDNPWAVPLKERRGKCSINYAIIGLLLPDMIPFMYRASGISSGETQRLLTRFKTNKYFRNSENPNIVDYHRYAVAVSSTKEKTASGEAFAVHFGDILPIETDIAEVALNSSASVLGVEPQLTAPTEQKQIAEKTAEKSQSRTSAPTPSGPPPLTKTEIDEIERQKPTKPPVATKPPAKSVAPAKTPPPPPTPEQAAASKEAASKVEGLDLQI